MKTTFVEVVTVNIKFIDDEENHKLYVVFYEGNTNIAPRAFLRGFVEEMDYFDIVATSGTYDDEICFVLEKTLDTEILMTEVQRFVLENMVP